MTKRKNFSCKIRLQKRFTARKRDPALLAEIFFETQYFSDDLFCCIFRAITIIPRIGIMTAFATQITTLKKDNEPYTRSVDRSQTLE